MDSRSTSTEKTVWAKLTEISWGPNFQSSTTGVGTGKDQLWNPFLPNNTWSTQYSKEQLAISVQYSAAYPATQSPEHAIRLYEAAYL